MALFLLVYVKETRYSRGCSMLCLVLRRRIVFTEFATRPIWSISRNASLSFLSPLETPIPVGLETCGQRAYC